MNSAIYSSGKSNRTGEVTGDHGMMKNSLVILLGFITCGCSSTGLLKNSSYLLTAPVSAIAGKKKAKPVAKILCLWEAAEGQGLDEKPSRGFAGQVMFFGYGEASPIAAHGTVRIYEYVDFDANDEDPKPVHEFVFDDGGWNAHRVTGTLGQSYNVFLPVVQKKKEHVVCALRVEFESEDGRIISSPFTEVTLAAKTSNRPAAALQRNIVKDEKPKVRQASAVRRQELSKQEVRKKLESTTIKLPVSL